MRLTSIERDARDNGKILVGVGHAGLDNLTGPIISCAVILDYQKVTPELVECALNNFIPKEQLTQVEKAVKLINTDEIDALRLNSIADTNVASYLADYHALYGCVFEVFHKYSGDPDYVYSEQPIKEVIENKELSLYTNKKNKSSYIVMKDWNQFDNLIPNTKFKVEKATDNFTLMFAKACANTRLQHKLNYQKKKYPNYNFDIKKIDENERIFLQKNGLTEFHRAYLPELTSFAFRKNILI